MATIWHRAWLRSGIAGAAVVPMAMLVVSFGRPVSPDSQGGGAALNAFIVASFSPIMTMFEVLGVSGCGTMAYIIPIYALWLPMLGVIGFGLGVATHWAVSGLARQSRQRDG